MRIRWFLGIFFSVLLIALLSTGISSYLQTHSDHYRLDLFIGIDAPFNSVENTKLLVDEVKSYTNFFVIGSTAITWNATKLNEVCQYLNDCGLYFDKTQFMVVKEANNYTDAACKFVENVGFWLEEIRYDWGVGDFPLITSDYVLYEFDYKAGYDAVLAEFGWNHSRPLNVALCRGAASMQNKEWGVMITWTYDIEPYIESGKELYDDMVYAYQNGAKYILVFNYPEDTAFGILKEEHLEALEQFWLYVKDNPRFTNEVEDKVAYVLPKDYGFGFRKPNDKIWGLWDADNQSKKIWSEANSLLEQYREKLDIIYEDYVGQRSALIYEKLIFWNGTILDRDNIR